MLELELPWDRQPTPKAEPDPRYALAELITPSLRAASVTGAPLRLATGQSYVAGPDGIALRMPASTTGVETVAPSSLYTAVESFSVIGVYRPTTAVGSLQRAIQHGSIGAASSRWSLGSDASGRPRTALWNTTGTQYNATAATSAAYASGVRIVHGFTLEGTTLLQYINGQLDGSVTIAGTPRVPTVGLTMGGELGASASLAADYLLLALVSRPLSATEHAEIARSIWRSLFATRTIYIPTPAAGGGTTDATVSAAALAFSAQTLTGSSIAATTPAAVALTFTDTAAAGSSVAAASVSAAALTFTAADMAGVAGSGSTPDPSALTFTAQALAGSSIAAATLDAATLTFSAQALAGSDAGGSIISAAALTFTTQALAGESTAAAAIDVAALTFAANTLAGPEAEESTRRGGAYRNRFVEGRKRIALQRLLSYLTEDDPPAETKRQVRAVKAGKPVPEEERKPPVVMQEVSAEKLAAKIIPERIKAIEQAAAAGLDVQRVILKAIEMARERDEEEVMLLL